jgi:hypothetical protein
MLETSMAQLNTEHVEVLVRFLDLCLSNVVHPRPLEPIGFD